MKHALTAVAVAVLLSASARASSGADRVSAIGSGTNTCGAFVSAKPGSSEENEYLAWLAGFISGTNVWNAYTRADILDGIDMPAIKVWMQNYCRSNPLETVLFGAKKLGLELIERRKGDGRPPGEKPDEDPDPRGGEI